MIKIITSNHSYSFSFRNLRATISCSIAIVVRKVVDSVLEAIRDLGQWATQKLNERGV